MSFDRLLVDFGFNAEILWEPFGPHVCVLLGSVFFSSAQALARTLRFHIRVYEPVSCDFADPQVVRKFVHMYRIYTGVLAWMSWELSKTTSPIEGACC